MSPSLRLLQKADALHSALWAESVTFRDVSSVKARINYRAPQPSGLSSEVQISQPIGSTILLPQTLPQPQPDEIIYEEDGTQHRIQTKAKKLGYAWQCDCDVI
jgi:hypothetical protein